MGSPVTKDRAYVCSSLTQSQPRLGLACSFPLLLSLCTLCILSSLDFSGTSILYTNTFPSDCTPCPHRVKIRGHFGYLLAVCHRACRALLYVCPCCTVQTPIDSMYVPHEAPPQRALLLSPIMEMFLESSSEATVDGGLNLLWVGTKCVSVLLRACKTLARFTSCPSK